MKKNQQYSLIPKSLPTHSPTQTNFANFQRTWHFQKLLRHLTATLERVIVGRLLSSSPFNCNAPMHHQLLEPKAGSLTWLNWVHCRRRRKGLRSESSPSRPWRSASPGCWSTAATTSTSTPPGSAGSDSGSCRSEPTDCPASFRKWPKPMRRK